MSIEAVSAIDADLARVASAQLQLASAHAQEVPLSGTNPSQVEQAHAAVAAAEAALAAAQSALNAAQASHSSPVTPNTPDRNVADPNAVSPAPLSTHLVDTTV